MPDGFFSLEFKVDFRMYSVPSCESLANWSLLSLHTNAKGLWIRYQMIEVAGFYYTSVLCQMLEAIVY